MRTSSLVVVVWSLGCLSHDAEVDDVSDEPATASPVAEAAGAPSRGVSGVAREAVADARAPTPRSAADGPIPRDGVDRRLGSGPDAVIFERAQRAAAAGDTLAMKAAYLELIREHPLSGYVPEAYYALADHYFDRDEPDNASKLYDRILSFPDAEAAVWAAYKLAWCKLRLAQPTDALDHFVRALRRIDAGALSSTSQAELLAAAVRRDMILPYAEVGRPDKARVFFERLGGGKGADDVPVAEQLQLLSARYAETGHADEAAYICRDLAATDARVDCDR